MNRRNFVKGSTLTGAALLASSGLSASMVTKKPAKPFNLKFAPHDGMFKEHAGKNILDQLQFMKDQGFAAFEDNGMKNRDVSLQKKIGEKLASHGMDMGVFVAHKIHWKEPSLVLENHRDTFLNEITESVEVAKRCGAKWMTVVPGYLNLREQPEYSTAVLVETLKQAAGILEPHGLVMVLEPLNFRNHPGLFLTRIPQAYLICQAVASPSCKILFDIYHQQIQEGNIIPNIEDAWEEIAYFQIGDNPGRKEPGTGEINYYNVFRKIHEKGFKGILGMEHGNSQSGKEGEIAVIEAYRKVDI
ncbi:MAG: TIM barrel protein [Bacteroidota bacterium]